MSVLCHRICSCVQEPIARAARQADGDSGAPDLQAMCDKINRLPKPPLTPATPDNVVIFSALVANDQVDSYSTRFSVSALSQISERLAGAPGLRNHSTYQSSDMPVMRWFDGAQASRDGVSWARGWSYMSSAPEAVTARELANAIDLAIINEVSLSWWQDGLRCSICGKDMWAMDDEGHYVCTHNPGQSYNGEVCVGEMDSIREIAECSLVWKGGQYGTQLESPGARSQQDVETLVQRIARKRSTVPAPAGESELDLYLGQMVRTPSEFEAWYNAG